jgi:CrcB protein
VKPALLAAFTLAGALGAAARYLLDFTLTTRFQTLPWSWGTLSVNLSGAFLMGFLVGLSLHYGLPEPYRALLGGGFLGAYTTFSTWMYETVKLLEREHWHAAYVSAAFLPLLGVALSALGFALAGWG